MLILSLQHIPQAKDTRFHNYMLLNFKAEAKVFRPRPEVTRPKVTRRGQNFGLEASLASRQFGLEALTSLHVKYHYEGGFRDNIVADIKIRQTKHYTISFCFHRDIGNDAACLSVCLSHAGIYSKLTTIRSR